jgi:PAS domain S-box-containing protein
MSLMNKPRILVVDDDEGARRTLTLILERKGYDVVTASTAQKALKAADDGRFNVGLLDIRLPDVKGVELLSPLQERHPDMELIMVTGYASSETAIRALNEGATAYITKPLNMDEVLAEVRKVLEKQHLMAEKRRAEEQIDHVNAVLRAIRNVNQLIVREKDPGLLIQGACDSLVETRGYLSACIALRGDSGQVSQMAVAEMEGYGRGLRKLIDRGEWPPCARRAQDDLDVVITDVSPTRCGDCPLAEMGGVRSGMAAPLEHGGKVYGALLITAAAGFAAEEEASLFREVADDIALGLHGIELEREQERAARALEASERKFRTLFDNSSDAIVIHDLDGRLVEINQVACERLGYRRDELLQMSIQDLDAPEHVPKVAERIADLRRRGYLIFETSHVRKDGTEIPVEVSSRLIDYGGRQAVLSSARDISDRLDMERQLHRQERMAAVGQLAGGIAHDFRNFLTTIILYAGMPLGAPDLSPRTQEALGVIASEAQQASDLVQQILDFSGRSVMEKQPVDLVEFIEEAADILRQTIPESIRVNLALEPAMVDGCRPDDGRRPCVVEADPTRIQQVLMNLALNARDAMTLSRGDEGPEGGELKVALSRMEVSSAEDAPVPGMAPGEWVRLTVSDTGTGMSEEVKERIFEPFFTTKERSEGTGLGLAQVYGIVQQHQGQIDVETELGVGTSFHVYLPAYASNAAHAGKDVEHTPASIPEGRGETVLLVEDQEKLREAGRSMLASLDYRVLTAANGREALEMLEGLQVDLVITDIVMPEMGGKSLMRELTQVLPNLPVLAITGYTMREEVEDLKKTGFFDVLRKPFDAPSLAQAVRRALDME